MNIFLAAISNTATNATPNIQFGQSLHGDLGAWATLLAVIVAIIVAVCESRRHRFAQGVDLILRLDDRFSSEEWLTRRDAAAKSLGNKTYKTSTDKTSQDADDVLDFFETIGYLLSRGAVDEKMVWHTFFHWIMGYCQAAEEYISVKRQREPKGWQDLIDLHHRMEAIKSYEVPNEEFLSGEVRAE